MLGGCITIGRVIGNCVNYNLMGCIHATVLSGVVIKLFLSEFQVEFIKVMLVEAWVRSVTVCNS